MTTMVSNVPVNWRWNGYSFKAMNTRVQTWLYSQTDSAVLIDVQRLFNSVEKRLSRFDPNSELSRLNANGREAFQTSPILLDAVEIALWAAEATGGLYDPTILTALEKAGYDRSFEQVAHIMPLHHSASIAESGQPSQPIWRPFTFRTVQLNRANREIYKIGLGFLSYSLADRMVFPPLEKLMLSGFVTRLPGQNC